LLSKDRWKNKRLNKKLTKNNKINKLISLEKMRDNKKLQWKRMSNRNSLKDHNKDNNIVILTRNMVLLLKKLRN
jgi:hypothetical protein